MALELKYYSECDMALAIDTMTDFLIDFGAKEVPHTNKNYFAHAVGVYRDMRKWQADDEVCRAAMFHSIYGTEGFQTLTLPLNRRGELRDLIGARAEKLVYANCAMQRQAFYCAVAEYDDHYRIPDRLAGGWLELTRCDFEDLMRLHLCDFLELVERTAMWDYERSTMALMSERLGGVMRQAYLDTFAREPQLD